ncbi:hypothetical protein EYZ11_009299 [Aspergillus tanneri]|uniref:Myo-inositol transporter n=1 Tax=Aspergillus tanneri TaxID=1220188 RepID=A0A4S3JDP8_9EURO|nr:myo-inositol transporter [Aspergillus tanneri]KAA8652322.1 myo-inositol transporter [Aspergillus tanneri]THC91241.1 hypothetical protein EYZ11_009299 [Aspergillus tanneri]
MSSMGFHHELHIASLAVQRASIVTKHMQSVQDKGSRDKEDASPVTVADFAAQAILIGIVKHHFPNDHVIGEESASALRQDPGLIKRVWELVTLGLDGVDDQKEHDEILQTMPSSPDEMLEMIDLGGAGGHEDDMTRAWILDPIDGTKTFVRGQQYAVSLALVEDGEQKLGVVGYPNMAYSDATSAERLMMTEDGVDVTGYGTLLSAVKGQGAFQRPMTGGMCLHMAEPLIQSSVNKTELVFVEATASPYIAQDKHAAIRAQLQATAPFVDLWSMQTKYGALSVGAGNAMVRIPREKDYCPWVWDHAGGMLVYEESGGKLTDLDGRPFNYARGRRLMDNFGVVATLPQFHDRLLEVARQFLD